MNPRLLFGAGGLLVFAGALLATLLTPVYADRGRDEIDLLTLHQLYLEPGNSLTQPVRLQRADATAIRLPYVWLESNPAMLGVIIDSPDGANLLRTTLDLPNSQAPLWEEPISDGSAWESSSAAFATIRLPRTSESSIILRLTRTDNQQGTLNLFANLLPKRTAGVPTDTRPPIVELPGQILTYETEYGGSRPALAKIPTYLSRLQSLAPPWLPSPLPELLFLVTVGTAIFCYAQLLGKAFEAPQ